MARADRPRVSPVSTRRPAPRGSRASAAPREAGFVPAAEGGLLGPEPRVNHWFYACAHPRYLRRHRSRLRRSSPQSDGVTRGRGRLLLSSRSDGAWACGGQLEASGAGGRFPDPSPTVTVPAQCRSLSEALGHSGSESPQRRPATEGPWARRVARVCPSCPEPRPGYGRASDGHAYSGT